MLAFMVGQNSLKKRVGGKIRSTVVSVLNSCCDFTIPWWYIHYIQYVHVFRILLVTEIIPLMLLLANGSTVSQAGEVECWVTVF